MWSEEKTIRLLRQLGDITEAVERLYFSMSELGPKQLIMLHGPYVRREERSEANFFTALNNSTAEWIQSTLRELEDTVNVEMEGAEDSKELVNEFIQILWKSIRALNEDRIVQETRLKEINERLSHSSLYSEGKFCFVRSPVQINFRLKVVNFFRKICICL